MFVHRSAALLIDSTAPIVATGYDTAGRATSEIQTILGVARTVANRLDAASNRTRLTWPNGFAVDYTFDALSRMSTATVTGGAQLAHPLSRRTSLSHNSGSSSMGYSYSNADDLLTLTEQYSPMLSAARKRHALRVKCSKSQ